ncbi:hypothetical protein DFH28DRAFT_391456 [Melampsora americana]|nr:hypothetical protein DFH28DRAFT_391456 [Melampsora americana]
MDKILHKDKDSWTNEEVSELFEVTIVDVKHQVVLFRILRQFLDDYDVSLRLMQEILYKLDTSDTPWHQHPLFSQWELEVKDSQVAFRSRMATRIRELQPQELQSFLALQDDDHWADFSLKKSWDHIYQKDILAFFITLSCIINILEIPTIKTF